MVLYLIKWRIGTVVICKINIYNTIVLAHVKYQNTVLAKVICWISTVLVESSLNEFLYYNLVLKNLDGKTV